MRRLSLVLDRLNEDIAALVESLWYRPSNPEFYIVLATGRSEDHGMYMALDDRDRVVAMWRSNGMRTLQVDNGNF